MSGIEKSVGAKITEARLSRKLTQFQLAEKVNVSVETISRLERGVTMPSLKTLENMADTLKTPLTFFFETDAHPSENPVFEREISKINAFLRTLSRKELALARQILKTVFHAIKSRKL
jgi:transcriptional regulator with XRE-family HTH domain